MLHALDIYRRLVSMRVRAQMQYRLPFLLETLQVGLATGISFLTLALVLQRFQNVGGWTLGEVAFLYGMVETAFGLMDMLFSGFDPDVFAVHVRRGALDQMLLRPVSLTVQVFGSEFVLRRIGRIAQGIAVLAVAISLAGIHWTVWKALYLPVVVLSQVAFFGGLFVIGATISFWTVQSVEAINIFTYGGSEMMSYPMHIYQDWMRRFFTYILPAIFLNYYPALYFLGKPDPFHLPSFTHFLAPLAGFAVLAVGMGFWRFGQAHYQSTGT